MWRGPGSLRSWSGLCGRQRQRLPPSGPPSPPSSAQEADIADGFIILDYEAVLRSFLIRLML